MKYNKRIHSDFQRECMKLRIIHDLTIDDVAELTGVARSLVYKYERQMHREEKGTKMRKLDEFYKTLRAVEVVANENLV